MTLPDEAARVKQPGASKPASMDLRVWWIPALVAAVACALLPMGNPDVFWHLTAGDRILTEGHIPSKDWLSFTHPNVPWTDFEWLAQPIYALVHRVAGFSGILALKAVLIMAVIAVQAVHLRRSARSIPIAAAVTTLLAAALLPASDIRPDTLSLIGFALIWNVVGQTRNDKAEPPWWVWTLGFSLWANAHAGFAYGFLLLGTSAVQRSLPPRWGGRGVLSLKNFVPLIAAFAGTLLHPHPIGQYLLLREVARDLPMISQHIDEWKAVSFSEPHRIAHGYLLVASIFAVVFHAAKKRTLPVMSVLLLAFFGVQATLHARLCPYFAIYSAPLCVSLVMENHDENTPVRPLVPAVLTAAALALTLVLSGIAGTGRQVFHWENYPLQAAHFLKQNRAVLGGDGLYHPWHWGGYLGRELWPAYRVFQDGRYIFHSMLPEGARAERSPERWQTMMDRYHIRVAVMPALETTFHLPWRAPDGHVETIELPYDMVFMHPSRWALVTWDATSLVFVRRGAVPAAWLDAHEYKIVRPGIPPALASLNGDAARRDAEISRHERELQTLR
jgi:hypothetical protein